MARRVQVPIADLAGIVQALDRQPRLTRRVTRYPKLTAVQRRTLLLQRILGYWTGIVVIATLVGLVFSLARSGALHLVP